MATLELAVDVAAPARAAFDVLADFGAFLDWNAYEGVSIEVVGDGIGMVRTLVLPGFGRVGERLDVLDHETRTLGYSLVEGTPIGMATYRAEVRVEADGEDRCRLIWYGEFEPVSAGSEAEVAPLLRQSYEAMSARLGGYLAGNAGATDP